MSVLAGGLRSLFPMGNFYQHWRAHSSGNGTSNLFELGLRLAKVLKWDEAPEFCITSIIVVGID